jgi:TonB-dependent starch-binding outer membrane protein SusC
MTRKLKSYTILKKTKKYGLALLFLLVSIHLSAIANADTLVNLQRRNISISEVFKALKQQTGLIVFYNNNLLDDKKKLDVDFNQVSVSAVMDYVLRGTNISYVVKEKFILLQKKVITSTASNLLSQASVQNTYYAPPPADTLIKGSVSSDSSLPLSGVSVQVKGAAVGTTTDSLGNFSLRVPNKNSTLIFSFVGYENLELKLADQKRLNVQLHSASADLQQVVVIGYGTVKKSDVTGSTVSLKASELTSGANVNVQQMLQGRASGVTIQQKSGEPGSAISVQVRGITSITAGNDPLYVIDGMPVNNDAPVSGTGAFFATPSPRNPLNSLNPSDIASIDILKDASATAIYGSRGANGVVIITTKSGSSGRF